MSLRSARALPVVLVFLLASGSATALAPATTPGAGGVGVASTDATAAAVSSHNGTLPPSEQVMRVTLQSDGDARWHVSARYALATRNEAVAFRTLASRFEAGETDQLAVDAFAVAAVRARVATDRSMEFRNVTRSHRVENGTGVLVVSFTWTNFAETPDERLVVGDAFNTTSGTWLPSLNERQTLIVEPPEGYGVRSSPPVPVANGVARWEGPVTFSGRGPWIVYTGSPETRTSATPGTQTGTPGPGDDDTSLGFLFFVVAVGGGVAALVAYLFRRSDDDAGTAVEPGPDSGSGPDGGEATAVDPSVSEGADGVDSGDTTTGGGATAGTTDAAEEDDVDVALLSDEERVERLLEQNGGRMKQASIVKETGWSNAKVSQLLSSMDDDDRIDKLRIGRENLISFPDENVTDFDFDAETDDSGDA